MKTVILGGGVSGLSLAYFLAKRGIPVHLFEASHRLGGWVQTVKADGHVLELGPRTLRPSGVAGATTLNLVHELGIAQELIKIPKTAPAASNRFLYSHNMLQALPNSILSALTSKAPVASLLRRSVWRDLVAASSTQSDESIHTFITRRFGEGVSDQFVSAIIHGIYAGDVRQLSVKSTLSFLWEAERLHGSVLKGLMRGSAPVEDITKLVSPKALEFVRETQKHAIYTFKGGMEILTQALVKALQSMSHVKLETDAPCRRILPEHRGIQVDISGTAVSCNHIISTIPAHRLSPLVVDPLAVVLNETPFVTVAVVNLVFKGKVLPVKGFGYLVPRAQDARILGVVFDSCVVPSEDTVVTVMMGGYRFKELFGDKPQNQQLLDTALDQIRCHLRIFDEPVMSKVSVQQNCIPQYTVGHSARVGRAMKLSDSLYNERLTLGGASFGGVALNDCIRQSKLICEKVNVT